MHLPSPTSLSGTKRPTADAGTSYGFTASGDAFILIDRFCRSIVACASGIHIPNAAVDFGGMPERSRRERLREPVASRASGEEEARMPTGRRTRDGWFERFFKIRRDAREAEGAPLLREYRVKSLIEGSNPSLSAIFESSGWHALGMPAVLLFCAPESFAVALGKATRFGVQMYTCQPSAPVELPSSPSSAIG